jgi:hypothetical protein
VIPFNLYRVIAVGLPVLALLLSLGQAQARVETTPVWIVLDGASGPEPVRVVAEADEEGIAFEIRVPGLWAGLSGDEAETRLWLEGESGRETAGPDLPVLRWTVEVPAGLDVTLEIEGVTEHPFSLAGVGLPERLAQIRPEDCKCENAALPPVMGAEPAGQPVLRINGEYVASGRRVVVVEIRPVGYNAGGALVVRDSARGRLRFAGGAGRQQAEH